MPGPLSCNTSLFAPCWWVVKTVHGNVTTQFVTVLSEWKQVAMTCRSPSLSTSSLLCCSWHHPHESFQLFLSPCSRCMWLGWSLGALDLSWVRGWSSAFPCHSSTIPNHVAVACGGVPSLCCEHWRGDSPPKSTVDMGIDFWSGKKGKNLLSQCYSLPSCPSAKTVTEGNDTAALAAGQYLRLARLFLLGWTSTNVGQVSDLYYFIYSQKKSKKSRFSKCSGGNAQAHGALSASSLSFCSFYRHCSH